MFAFDPLEDPILYISYYLGCLFVPFGLLKMPITNTEITFWVAPDELLPGLIEVFFCRFPCVGRLKQYLLNFPIVFKQLETTHIELDTGFLQLSRDIRGL